MGCADPPSNGGSVHPIGVLEFTKKKRTCTVPVSAKFGMLMMSIIWLLSKYRLAPTRRSSGTSSFVICWLLWNRNLSSTVWSSARSTSRSWLFDSKSTPLLTAFNLGTETFSNSAFALTSKLSSTCCSSGSTNSFSFGLLLTLTNPRTACSNGKLTAVSSALLCATNNVPPMASRSGNAVFVNAFSPVLYTETSPLMAINASNVPVNLRGNGNDGEEGWGLDRNRKPPFETNVKEKKQNRSSNHTKRDALSVPL